MIPREFLITQLFGQMINNDETKGYVIRLSPYSIEIICELEEK